MHRIADRIIALNKTSKEKKPRRTGIGATADDMEVAEAPLRDVAAERSGTLGPADPGSGRRAAKPDKESSAVDRIADRIIALNKTSGLPGNLLKSFLRGGTDISHLISGVGRRRIARAAGHKWMPGQGDLAMSVGGMTGAGIGRLAAQAALPLSALATFPATLAAAAVHHGQTAKHYGTMDDLLLRALYTRTPHRVTPGWRGKSLANHALKYDRPLDSVVYGGSPRNTEALIASLPKRSSAGAVAAVTGVAPSALDAAGLLLRKTGLEGVEMNVRKALAGKGEVVLPGFDWPIIAGLNPNRKSFKALRELADIPLSIETNSRDVAMRAALRGVPVQVIDPATGAIVRANRGAGSEGGMAALYRSMRNKTSMETEPLIDGSPVEAPFNLRGFQELTGAVDVDRDDLISRAAEARGNPTDGLVNPAVAGLGGAAAGAAGAPALEAALKRIFTPEFSAGVSGKLRQMGQNAAMRGAAAGGPAAQAGRAAQAVGRVGGEAAGKGADAIAALLRRLPGGAKVPQRLGVAGLAGAGAVGLNELFG